MGSTFQDFGAVAVAFDLLSARVDGFTRDLKFHAVRTELQPRVDQILAGYNGVALPSLSAAGMFDADELDAALCPLGVGHVHTMPEARRHEVKQLLRSMGRL